MTTTIDLALAQKVLAVIDAGLVAGMGDPEPGKMCVEAAVCYAMGLPHSDRPTCVAPALRDLKVRLNDARWSSNSARTAGLRRLGIAQLGSAGVLDEKEFAKRCAALAIKTCVPNALRAVAAIAPEPFKTRLIGKAALCEVEPTRHNAIEARDAAREYRDAAYAAYAAAAADAADAAVAARDKILAAFAEAVVQILIDLKAPGCKWLSLAPLNS